MWYGNSSNQDCKALQRVVRLAERISGSALPSLQDIYFKRCKSRAAKIIKDSTHPGNHLLCLLPSGSSGAWWQKLRDWGGASSLRSSDSLTQTQSHKHLQDSLLTVKHPYSHHPYCCFVYIPCTTPLHIPLAHPSCSYYYLLSPSILVFLHNAKRFSAKSYCFALFIPLHIWLLFLFFFTIYCICSCVLLLLYNFYFYSFALSTERTWFDLHFTSDYTLYNLLCDK